MANLIIFLFLSTVIQVHARPLSPEEADYSIERQEIKMRISANGNSISNSYTKVKILNERGRSSLGTMVFSYSPDSTKLTLKNAFVINGGQKIEVPRQNIVDQAIRIGELGFDDTRQIMISFPQVQVGSELQYEMEAKSLVPPIENVYSEKIELGANGVEKSFNLEIESEPKLNFEVNDPTQAMEIEKIEPGGRKKNHYKITNNKIIFHQFFDEARSGMDEKKSTWVKLSTENNYSEMFTSLAKKYEEILRSEIPEEFSSLIRSGIDDKNSDPVEKIGRIVANLSEKMRYMGDWRGVKGAIVPRALSKIVETRSGDCKDLSILLTKILRGMGFSASVALVYRGFNPPLITQVPVFSFNHAIVFLKIGDKKYWIDPTNFQSFTRGVFEDISDRKGLVLAPGDVHFENIDFNAPEENFYRSVTECEISLKNKTGKSKMIIDLAGLSALPFTGVLLQLSKQQFEDAAMSNLVVKADLIRVKLQSPELKDRVVKPVRLNIEWEARLRPILTTVGPAYSTSAPEFISEVSKLDVSNRVSDIKLGPPLISEERNNFKSVRFTGDKLKSCSVKSKWLDYSFSFNPKKLEIVYNTKIKKYKILSEEFETSEFKNFKSQLGECARDRYLIYK